MEKDPVSLVAEKYIEGGWSAVIAPKTANVDLIAGRGDRMHFVRVNVDEDEPAESQNNFIQNAFSNGATPIEARVVKGRKNIKIKLEDVNLRGRVVVRKGPGRRKRVGDIKDKPDSEI